MYLLDTNVISELRKKEKANQGVITFFQHLNRSNTNAFLSAVTLGELRRGIELIRHRKDFTQANLLENWFSTILTDYSDKILPIDQDIAQLWGRLRVPNPSNELDKLIAATAILYDLTVVTRNVTDFLETGAKVYNPFT